MSPLMCIFGGKFRSTVRPTNQPDTVITEDWRSLQLIRPDSVYFVKDALEHISQLRPIQASQLSSSEVSQRVQIEVLPSLLVLHLKRFLYDAAADGLVNKISKPVQFAPELGIPLDIMTPVAGKSVEPAHYKLHGVLYHHGESAGSGHYMVSVLRKLGYTFDGETVSTMRHEDMFGGHWLCSERGDNPCAYMLFYCRTPSAQT